MVISHDQPDHVGDGHISDDHIRDDHGVSEHKGHARARAFRRTRALLQTLAQSMACERNSDDGVSDDRISEVSAPGTAGRWASYAVEAAAQGLTGASSVIDGTRTPDGVNDVCTVSVMSAPYQ